MPSERAAQVMAMLLRVPVSAGWVDKASGRLAAQLGKAGFDAAMLAALAGEKALAADESPVNILDSTGSYRSATFRHRMSALAREGVARSARMNDYRGQMSGAD